MLSILDAYEKATTRRLIVSAFKQAGIRYMFPDPQSPERAVAYVDPTEARAVKKNVIILHGIAPVDRPPRGQIRVSDLILNGQMREEGAKVKRSRKGLWKQPSPEGNKLLRAIKRGARETQENAGLVPSLGKGFHRTRRPARVKTNNPQLLR